MSQQATACSHRPNGSDEIPRTILNVELGGLFESRGPAGAARPINNPSLHCHDPKCPFRTTGLKYNACDSRGGRKKRAIQHSLRSLHLERSQKIGMAIGQRRDQRKKIGVVPCRSPPNIVAAQDLPA
jgi:hypothetical protein